MLDQRGAFNIDNFCKWADIGRSHVYEEVQRGRLRLTKCGRRSLITFDDATAWLAALRRSAGKSPNNGQHFGNWLLPDHQFPAVGFPIGRPRRSDLLE